MYMIMGIFTLQVIKPHLHISFLQCTLLHYVPTHVFGNFTYFASISNMYNTKLES